MYTVSYTVDLCLLCLTHDTNLKNILSQDSDGVLVQEKIRFMLLEIINIEPETSKQICLHCLENLNNFYNFKQLCLQNIVKFNNIHTLNNTSTKEPYSNLQVTLIDINHFNVKSENESNRELLKTENLNIDNVVKSDPSENETGIEYVFHGEHIQTTEIAGEILRIENNGIVEKEHEDISDIVGNTAVQEENVFKEEKPMIVDDELKYEIVDEIVPDILEDNYDEIDIKSELDDDSTDTLQNETLNNAECAVSSNSSSNLSAFELSDEECHSLGIRSVPSSSRGRKRHFCIYCKREYFNLPRHLESAHADLPEVRNFTCLPKLSARRKDLIDKIRKKGDFEYNTNDNYIKEELKVCRRPSQKYKKDTSDYIPCPYCKGFFSKKSMPKHYQHCDENHQKDVKNVLQRGRQLIAKYHIFASESLKRRVLFLLRDDTIGNLIRHDFLIILLGNKLCNKYRSEHFNSYIRQILRMLGRLTYVMKSKDSSVSDLASIFTPKKHDLFKLAMLELLGMDKNTLSFRKPTLVCSIGTYIKKCGRLLTSHYIKQERYEDIDHIKHFLRIFQEFYSIEINTNGEFTRA